MLILKIRSFEIHFFYLGSNKKVIVCLHLKLYSGISDNKHEQWKIGWFHNVILHYNIFYGSEQNLTFAMWQSDHKRMQEKQNEIISAVVDKAIINSLSHTHAHRHGHWSRRIEYKKMLTVWTNIDAWIIIIIMILFSFLKTNCTHTKIMYIIGRPHSLKQWNPRQYFEHSLKRMFRSILEDLRHKKEHRIRFYLLVLFWVLSIVQTRGQTK